MLKIHSELVHTPFTGLDVSCEVCVHAHCPLLFGIVHSLVWPTVCVLACVLCKYIFEWKRCWAITWQQTFCDWERPSRSKHLTAIHPLATWLLNNIPVWFSTAASTTSLHRFIQYNMLVQHTILLHVCVWAYWMSLWVSYPPPPLPPYLLPILLPLWTQLHMHAALYGSPHQTGRECQDRWESS